MKRLIFIIILIFLFCVPASAEENIYAEQFDSLVDDSIENSLPEEAQSFFKDWDIDIKDSQWTEKLTAGNAFTMIWDFVKGGAKKPFFILLQVVAVLLMSSLVENISAENSGIRQGIEYAMSVVVCLVVATPLLPAVSATVSAIKGCGVFMLSFVPIFAGILTASGQTLTAVGSSGLLLTAAECCVQLAAFVILPLMSAYLALSISCSVSPLLKNGGITEAVKKTAMWVLSFIFTVFIGLLSIQTTVNAAADSVGVKTLKFMVGSFVPVAGSALSETITTLGGSLSIMKSSVGIYAVVALVVTLIPVLLELVFWRIVLILSGSISDMFAIPKAGQIFRSLDAVLAVLIGIVLFVGALFVISLATVIRTGGTV